jgi:transcriptional regulator, sir2 family
VKSISKNADMKKIVFLTGAGMSVESGFKTFRGNDGLWENYPVEKVATHEAWEDNPEFINNFYNGLRKKLFTAKPNDGHLLIKQLEDKYKVTVITQNVDDLHEMAGSTNVIHLHGELKKVCSSADAYNPKYRKELTEDAPNVMPGEKAGDGSLLRPFIVFFGESVPMIEPAIKEVSEADIFVIIGTSLNVYPAASLIHYVRTEVPVYLIDPNDVDSKYDTNITVIRKGASEGMRELIKEL